MTEKKPIDSEGLVQTNGYVQISEANGGFCCTKRRSPSSVLFLMALGLAIATGVAIGIYFILSAVMNHNSQNNNEPNICTDPCVLTMVESMPEGLTYPEQAPAHLSTYAGLMNLIRNADVSIEIASFYWTLNGSDASFHDNSSWQGESILESLLEAGRDRKIKLKIVQNIASTGYYNNTRLLQEQAGAQVRNLNFTKLLGNGILHTKMWLIDRKHFYVGSANLDWRSLTQVKEMGAVLYNCSCMAEDMGKLFDVYWYLGESNTIPQKWPAIYETTINNNNSMLIKFNNTNATTYLSSSPPELCPHGRTIDIDAIVNIINSADKFVYVAVMDYFPTTQFLKPNIYWPVIDDAFRRAAFNKHVKVYLLFSLWQHTWKEMIIYMRSLNALYAKYPQINIYVKLFEVPAFTENQRKIPYGRVNHNKYMVTDKTAYIGTSNWSGDYFINTAGIGFIVNQNRSTNVTIDGDFRQQLENVFLRDWNSSYAHNLSYWNVFWNKTEPFQSENH